MHVYIYMILLFEITDIQNLPFVLKMKQQIPPKHTQDPPEHFWSPSPSPPLSVDTQIHSEPKPQYFVVLPLLNFLAIAKMAKRCNDHIMRE